MSWQQVSVFFILVTGAIAAQFLKAENLAMVLAGGAAGYIGQSKGLQAYTSDRKTRP